MFYRYLRYEERTGESTVDLLASPKLWERIPQVLSPESVEALLAGGAIAGQVDLVFPDKGASRFGIGLG